MAASKIEWTGETWNPVTGCSRVSEGCRHCYAERMTHRLATMQPGKYAGLTVLTADGPRFNGSVRTHADALTIPLRRRKPTTYFVNSMSDLFHEGVPFHFIDQVFAVMALCQQHKFQVLTKRPPRMAEYLADLRMRRRIWAAVMESQWKDRSAATAWGLMDHAVEPLPNVWLGTSAEDQERFDERVPHLLRCPAAVRFISAEPLLGAIDATRYLPRDRYFNAICEHCGYSGSSVTFDECRGHDDADVVCPKCHRITTADEIGRIDWIIVGGESGPGARPMHPDWARSIRDQCVAAKVPFFFKQWGCYAPINYTAGGRNYEESMPFSKKAAGRVLDGRTWDEMPEAVTND